MSADQFGHVTVEAPRCATEHWYIHGESACRITADAWIKAVNQNGYDIPKFMVWRCLWQRRVATLSQPN